MNIKVTGEKPITHIQDRLSRNRKYTAFWAAFLAITVALFCGKLTGELYVDILWPVFGLYMAGNVGARYTHKDL